MNETENQEQDRGQQGRDAGPQARSASALEQELDVYPLRSAEEDPRWAIGVVWTWAFLAVGFIIFIVVLLVLGWFYD